METTLGIGMGAEKSITGFPEFIARAESHPPEGMVLQEFAGYCLWPSNRFGKWLALSGAPMESATYLRIVKTLVGADSAIELRAGALDNPYYRGLLRNMAVAYAVDHIEEHLKAAYFRELVDGDPVPARRENGGVFTFIPTCKLILVSEKPDVFHRPMLKEIRRRMLHVGMDRLLESPAPEEPPLARDKEALWRRAEAGYVRLNRNKHFSNP